MASESERANGRAHEQKASRPASSTGDRPKKKKLRRSKPPIPRTEDEIDSPSKQTVGMLGVLGIMTIVMWALARGGCNYHPPKETRTPRSVSTEDLAHDPKNAAIELQQRWLTRDFKGALELASGDVAQAVQHDQATCDAACLGERKTLEQKLLTSAVILDGNLFGANVRVTSLGLPGGPKTYLMRLERADSIWKATLRKPDDGVALPALPSPALLPHELSGAPFSSPSASSSASGLGSRSLIQPMPVHPTSAPTSK